MQYSEYSQFFCIALGFSSGLYFGAKFARDYYKQKYYAELEKDTVIYKLQVKNKYAETLTTQKNKIEFLKEYYKQGVNAIRKECSMIIEGERSKYDNNNLLSENEELRKLYFSTLEKAKELQVNYEKLQETSLKLERNLRETNKKLTETIEKQPIPYQETNDYIRGEGFQYKISVNGITLKKENNMFEIPLTELQKTYPIITIGKKTIVGKVCNVCNMPFITSDSRIKKCSNC